MGCLDKALRSISNTIVEKEMDKESLLNTPIQNLKKPLAVHSQILDEVIYLVPNEAMAKEVEAMGGVAYKPDEIKVLSGKSKTMGREEWIELLKIIHHTKRIFLGSSVQS